MENSPVFQHLSRLTKREVLEALQDLERERAELAGREAALRAVLPYAQGDEEADDEAPAVSEGRVTLRQTIRAILASEPGRHWTTDDLFQAVRDQGKLTSGTNARTQLTNRLRTMRKEREVVQHDDGTYTLASESRSAPASGAGNAR